MEYFLYYSFMRSFVHELRLISYGMCLRWSNTSESITIITNVNFRNIVDTSMNMIYR